MYIFYPPKNNFNYFVIYDEIADKEYLSDGAYSFDPITNDLVFRVVDNNSITINISDINANESLPAIYPSLISSSSVFFDYINNVYNLPKPSKGSLNYQINSGALVQEQFLKSESFSQEINLSPLFLFIYPIFFEEDVSFNYINVITKTTTAGNNNLNLSIYEPSVDFLPGKAIFNFNSPILETNGLLKIEKPMIFSKGIKWFGVSPYSGFEFFLFGENNEKAKEAISNEFGGLVAAAYLPLTSTNHPSDLSVATGTLIPFYNNSSIIVPVFMFSKI